MKHFYKELLGAVLVSATVLGAHAEQGIVVIAKDGSQTEVSMPKVQRIDIGDSGITLHQAGAGSVGIAYDDLDRILIGAEISAVKDIVATGEIAVWPTRVTDCVYITGISAGTVATAHSLGGIQAASATAGDDSTARLDLSQAPAGVYIINAGNHSVKVIKN